MLIDEVDKADMEFPNDLLHELDRMSFTVMETGDVHTAKNRPLVIITSNNEKSYRTRSSDDVSFTSSRFLTKH